MWPSGIYAEKWSVLLLGKRRCWPKGSRSGTRVPRREYILSGLTMRTFVAILLASLLSFAIGRHSGRADAECEAYTSGYEAGILDIQNEMESK